MKYRMEYRMIIAQFRLEKNPVTQKTEIYFKFVTKLLHL